MNRLRAALAAILAAMLLAPAASASAAPETKKIGIESNGRTVTLERGQQLHQGSLTAHLTRGSD